MKTITFYSYKGGVGRSLALSNVANRLSEFGKKVCIMDFDLEAPGMHLKFEKNIGSQKVKNGLVDYIHQFMNSQVVPENILDYVTNIAFNQGSNRCDISLIAAGNTLSKEYWRKLSSINWNDFFYENNSLGVDFFLNLKEQIRSQINPDFLLIDSRTGITDVSGVTMSIFADEVVLMAANNKENLEGIAQVMKTLAIPANSIQNKVPKMNFVLCRIPYFVSAKDKPKETNAKNTALRFLNRQLLDAEIEDFQIEKVLVIHSDPELELQEKIKISYEHDRSSESNVIPIGLDYLELFEEITHDVLSEEEKLKFNEFLKAEFLIEKAIASPDLFERIKGLKAALKINARSSIANYQIANAYFDLDQYDKSLEFIREAISISPSENVAYFVLEASAYLYLNRYLEAKEVLNDVLTKDPSNFVATATLAIVHYRSGEYQDALKLQKKNVENHPNIDLAWNDYANTLRRLGRSDEALDAIYHALEINPTADDLTGSLAEIHAAMGNYREFYKNLELSFSFGMSSKAFQEIISHEDIYRQFENDEKFKSILQKYNIDVSFQVS